MAKDVTEQSNQLNLTVVALVALVAIVGLVALVLNASSLKGIAFGVAQASAEENLAGNAYTREPFAYYQSSGGSGSSGAAGSCTVNGGCVCKTTLETNRCLRSI